MKPGMKMLAMQKMREEPRPRSEYAGDNTRRMIGYDRNYERERTGNDGRYERERTPYNNVMPERRIWPRGEYDEPESRYEPYGGYEPPEMRRRRGDDGRYMMGGGYDRPESRRRRDDRGRYAMMEDDDEDYPRMMGNSYGDIYAKGEIYAPGAMNRPGGMQHQRYEPVDEQQAMHWVRKMKQPEGGRAMPAFKMEEAEALCKAHCPGCDPVEFFVALNMKYSDDYATAKKFGIDRPEFYAWLAKDFLMDDDAGPHKLQKYMQTIPEK